MLKTILLVEDDKAILDSVTELLMDEGYQVLSAKDGLVALELLEKGFQPNLILLDLMMPKMDGVALSAALQSNSRYSPFPVIVMSARSKREAISAIAGAKDFVKKPFDIEDFIGKVKKWIS